VGGNSPPPVTFERDPGVACGGEYVVRAHAIPGSSKNRAGESVMVERGESVLSRPCPEGAGDTGPVLAEREALGQGEPNATNGGDDLHPDLQQAVPEGRDLCAGTGGGRRVHAQFLHQDVGCRGEENAELVSENHSSTRSGHTPSEQGAVMRVRRPDLAGPDSRCRRKTWVTPGRVTACGRAYRRRARALARLFARRLHRAAGYAPLRRPGSNRTTSAHQCARAGMTLTAGMHD
jgi:hypothetical protein